MGMSFVYVNHRQMMRLAVLMLAGIILLACSQYPDAPKYRKTVHYYMKNKFNCTNLHVKDSDGSNTAATIWGSCVYLNREKKIYYNEFAKTRFVDNCFYDFEIRFEGQSVKKLTFKPERYRLMPHAHGFVDCLADKPFSSPLKDVNRVLEAQFDCRTWGIPKEIIPGIKFDGRCRYKGEGEGRFIKGCIYDFISDTKNNEIVISKFALSKGHQPSKVRHTCI